MIISLILYFWLKIMFIFNGLDQSCLMSLAFSPHFCSLFIFKIITGLLHYKDSDFRYHARRVIKNQRARKPLQLISIKLVSSTTQQEERLVDTFIQINIEHNNSANLVTNNVQAQTNARTQIFWSAIGHQLSFLLVIKTSNTFSKNADHF